jgi:hypothetical protein
MLLINIKSVHTDFIGMFIIHIQFNLSSFNGIDPGLLVITMKQKLNRPTDISRAYTFFYFKQTTGTKAVYAFRTSINIYIFSTLNEVAAQSLPLTEVRTAVMLTLFIIEHWRVQRWNSLEWYDVLPTLVQKLLQGQAHERSTDQVPDY